MNQQQTIEQLGVLIRARYPVIVVESHEESRVEEVVRAMAKASGKEFYSWTMTAGLAKEGDKPEAAKRLDPVAVFQHIIREFAPKDGEPYGKPAVFLIKDLHPYMQPQVVRSVRDAFFALQSRHQTVVLLSPNFTVPEDLRKGIPVIDFPLPGKEQLEAQMEAFIARLPEGIKVHLNGGRERLLRALQGLTEVEADSVLAQAVVASKTLNEDAITFVLREKARIIKESGALEYYPEQASYAEIGGLDLLKEWAGEAEAATSDEAAKFGIEPPKGVLLVGVPGCGKSLTAKAIAGKNRPLLRLDVGALFGGLVGQSEAQARNALKVAEAVSPCVLWIDEIEKALGGSGGEHDGGTSKRVLGTILTWMEETTAQVFVVATANDISTLRPELIRRFTEKFFVDLPDAAARAEIIAIHLSKRGRKPEAFDLAAITRATEGFTGSELEDMVQAGLRRAFKARKADVETSDMLAAAAQVVPLAQTMVEEITAMRQWATRARPASSTQTTGAQQYKATMALEI